MSDSDTGKTSRFKIKHIEPVTNVEGTNNSGDNSQNVSNSQDDDNQTLFTAAVQKLTNTKREKIKGRENHHQNHRHQIQGILPLQRNQSRKVILLKATDFKSYLNLRVTNGSFLVKWQIMSITSLSALFQKRM